MKIKFFKVLTLLIAANSASTAAFTDKKQQGILDKACETARLIALKPRKNVIFQECRNKFKKSESICEGEAQAYNGNRINGAPLFYELPACIKAFNYRKQQNNT